MLSVDVTVGRQSQNNVASRSLTQESNEELEVELKRRHVLHSSAHTTTRTLSLRARVVERASVQMRGCMCKKWTPWLTLS